jgi:prophage antirepressor-like protein
MSTEIIRDINNSPYTSSLSREQLLSMIPRPIRRTGNFSNFKYPIMNKYTNIDININIISLYYNDNEIKCIFDIDDVVWFKFSHIASILEYKDRNDVLKKHVDKKYRKHIKNIKTTHDLDKQKPDTVYITESGLYKLLIKSHMKKADKF